MKIRSHHIGLLLLAMLFSVVAWGQQVTLSGRVVDTAKEPLPGATVFSKAKQTGTVTDENGAFSLVAEVGDVLEISFTGFKAHFETVGTATVLNIILEESKNYLEELVVVGYGTAKKKDLTGSVATVTANNFQKGQISTPEQLIAGKVAGVQITPGSGAPGSGSRIRIRGGSSLNASNSPLIVIDGVPVDNGGISGVANPLALLNANDIESFNILKDASAAAIYGSRAANGVILITTKSGGAGQFKVNFSTLNSVGFKTGSGRCVDWG